MVVGQSFHKIGLAMTTYDKGPLRWPFVLIIICKIYSAELAAFAAETLVASRSLAFSLSFLA